MRQEHAALQLHPLKDAETEPPNHNHPRPSHQSLEYELHVDYAAAAAQRNRPCAAASRHKLLSPRLFRTTWR